MRMMTSIEHVVVWIVAFSKKVVSVIGYGYDLTCDIRLTACKPGLSGSSLIELNETTTKDLVVPGGVVVPNVSPAIKCDKGERTRFHYDVLTFNQLAKALIALSEKVKQEVPSSRDPTALAEYDLLPI
ncbi:hypothetical protein Tco_1516438 [Tanacetum coccineum]